MAGSLHGPAGNRRRRGSVPSPCDELRGPSSSPRLAAAASRMRVRHGHGADRLLMARLRTSAGDVVDSTTGGPRLADRADSQVGAKSRRASAHRRPSPVHRAVPVRRAGGEGGGGGAPCRRAGRTVLLGAVVAVGCDVPPGVRVEGTGCRPADPRGAGAVAQQECLAPVTTVAVVSVPAAALRAAAWSRPTSAATTGRCATVSSSTTAPGVRLPMPANMSLDGDTSR